MSLDIIGTVAKLPALKGWDGFGMAVQAYGKRARPVIAWADALGRVMNVRLVKGAYWDTEIKRAQVEGLDNYPLFTRKAATDVSYLACARDMLKALHDQKPNEVEAGYWLGVALEQLGDKVAAEAAYKEAIKVGESRPEVVEPYIALAQLLAAQDRAKEAEEVLADARKKLPDSTAIPWKSSGWNDDRSIRMLLEMMVMRGEIASLGWAGKERLWDLAERVYRDDPAPPLEEAFRERGDRELRSLGLDRTLVRTMQGVQTGVEPSGEPARVEGVRGTWRVDPAYLAGLDDFEGRCAILSPIDRLVFDRKRMELLFEFDYQLEMYKPAAKRRWGYWAMPVLYGDRLVGKVDATADREAGRLFVDAVHEDGRWTKAMRGAIEAELEDLAAWLGLEVAHT